MFGAVSLFQDLYLGLRTGRGIGWDGQIAQTAAALEIDATVGPRTHEGGSMPERGFLRQILRFMFSVLEAGQMERWFVLPS
jgi:hypothetical protein